MNASAAAIRGYAENAVSTRSDRRAEYDVFAKVTHRLRDTAQKAKTQFPRFVEALHDNQRLWTALTVDVLSPDNTLPEPLKARVLYLAEFTRQHTQKVLTQHAPVVPLLEINVAVMRGLKTEGQST
ncbi:MAG: flagellar biosynthesis regulator FlaF [Pseudomonadota bacterium]